MTLAINGALGLLPVLVFLAVLARSDTFKLINARLILVLILAGALAAFISKMIGAALMWRFPIDSAELTRFIGPVLEETIKALIIVLLISANRLGFALGAAIAGFAIGAGFALLENYYYLQAIGHQHAAIWVVRGFGTAIMHGGATAIFAVLAQHLTPKIEKTSMWRFLPGLVAAIALHVLFNQFIAYPVLSTIAMMIGLAIVLAFVLTRGRKSIEQVLAKDFETHSKLFHEIIWGAFGDSELEKLLHSLEIKFSQKELADIARYIRLHTALIIYTEALLRARERGGLVDVDETVVEKLEQFRDAEAAIGQAAKAALGRHLRFSRHESFKLHMLSREARVKRRRPFMGKSGSDQAEQSSPHSVH